MCFVDIVAASQLELIEGQLCERKDTHSVWLVWLPQHGIMLSLLYYLGPNDDSNQPIVVYPEVTVVVSATSRSVVLMNGGVIFLVMRLFSFEHG